MGFLGGSRQLELFEPYGVGGRIFEFTVMDSSNFRMFFGYDATQSK